MACVTLKRPLDFDPLEALHSPDRPQTKRRRCTPIKGLERESGGLNLPNPTETPGLPSAFLETVLSADEIASNLRDELKRLKHRRQLATQEPTHHASPNSPEPMNQEANESSSSSGNSSGNSSGSSSSSSTATSSSSLPLSSASNRVPATASAGVKPVSSSCSLQAQLSSSSSPSSSSSSASSSTTNASSSCPPPMPLSSSSTSSSSSMVKSVPSVRSWMGTRDKPVFTLKQMTLICERMCKERTEQVRQEYDRILQQKLCEQYDAFVKFIDQQIQERFHRGQLPSYLS